MEHSVLGKHDPGIMKVCENQVEFGAVEAGGGSTDSAHWNWNSTYWRSLGAPWGGVQSSARDIGKLIEEFMQPSQRILKSDTIQKMIRNHNPPGIETRGLGWDVGNKPYWAHCSEVTFGHPGSTGTIAWGDPKRSRVCVVLTSLPERACVTHPRQILSDIVASTCD